MLKSGMSPAGGRAGAPSGAGRCAAGRHEDGPGGGECRPTGPGREFRAPGAGRGTARLRRAEMHPPFFFVLPKKNAPCTVEEKGAGRDLCSAKVRPGVSSDGAGGIRKSSAACAIHRCLAKACRRKVQLRFLSRWKIERPVRLLPRVPLCYAHTRAVAEGNSHGLVRQPPQ